ncbi:hypothetical protein DUHN55_09300 [Helicobacter pylori]
MTDTSSTDAAERPLMLSDATEQFRYVVLALQRQGGRQLNRLFSTLGLTASQAEAIEVIGTFGPMTTRRAGEYLVCESGSPSRLLATLADKGLTVRSNPPEDRRATLHALSRTGREVLAQVLESQKGFNEQMSAAIADAERDFAHDRMRQLAELVVDPELRRALTLRFPTLYGLPEATVGP